MAQSPINAMVSDFNGDCIPDLAVGGTSVQLLLGDGTGAFAPAGEQPFANPASIAGLADFNGDGLPDVFALSHGAFGVMLVAADGGLGAFTQLATVGTPPGFGDFNEDGLPDLALPHQTGAPGGVGVFELVGSGPAGYVYGPGVPIVNYPGAPLVADFNGDGHLDLFVPATFGTMGYSLLLGYGDGGFSVSTVYGGQCFSSPTAGDFNGDGRLDVFVSGPAGCPAVFFGLPDGGLSQPIPVTGPGGTLAVADFDLDGKLDLIAGALNSVQVWRGRGDGSFSRRPQLYPANSGPGAVVVADFDRDAFPDVAVINGGSSDISFLQGNGGAVAAPPSCQGGELFSTAESWDVGASPVRSMFGDFTGVGISGFITMDDASFSRLPGQADGGFSRWTEQGHAPGAHDVAFADLDGDGHQDVAYTIIYFDDSDELISYEIDIQLGLADGGYGTPQRFIRSGGAFEIVATDLDGDGHPDLAATETNDGALLLMRNLGDGGFDVPRELAIGGEPTGITHGDFGPPWGHALIVGDYGGGMLVVSAPLSAWWLADGGVGATATHFAASSDVQNVAAADLDGDGQLDVAAVGESSVLNVFLRVDGGFVRSDFEGPSGEAISLGDVDGDGRNDIVTGEYAGTLHVLLNLGDGGFLDAYELNSSIQPHGVSLEDINNDGRADLVVLNQFNATLDVRYACPP